MATIKQVAERAGVSTATVSYVLNGTGNVTDATRQRVQSIMAELNYQPSHAARSMRGRSYTLGLALPSQAGRLADPALAEVLAGLSDTAATRGYSLLLAASDPLQTEAELCVSLVRTGRVDGIVLLDVQVADSRARALAEAGLPFVCDGPPPEAHYSSVVVDGHQAGMQATQYLLGLGHRRIGLIQLPSDMVSSEPLYLGYAQALEEAGVALDPQLVIEAGRNDNDGYLAMQELVNTAEPPTAVFASSDELAFGAMHALYDAGLVVGKDVSLVGFDDVPLAAHTHPPLTTLNRPRRMVGELLARQLVATIEQRSVAPRTTTLQTRLIIRRSTGVPTR